MAFNCSISLSCNLLIMAILPFALVVVLSHLPTAFSSEANLGTFTFRSSNISLSVSLIFDSPLVILNVIDLATKKTETYNASLKKYYSQECWGKIQQIALGVVLMLIVIPVVLLAVFVHVRKARDDRLLGEALRNLPGMPREYRYSELSRATANFAEENKLGEGAFGKVYRGKLPSSGEEVAVKSFKKETSRGDFLSELTIINRLHHRNLVSLLGWCYKDKKLLLVYAYMPNGSLDSHLYHTTNGIILPWQRRYHILGGVASALHYLHNDNDHKVIHRDIKSSNIMLDSCFNACLGDFGLARAIDEEKTSYEETSGVPGTWGYIAPECFHTGKATAKSDVFGFGAVVLEVICGRRPGTSVGGFRLLVDWVWTKYEEGNLLDTVDLRLQDKYDREEGMRLLLLGLACSHPTAGERPKIQTIVEILSKSLPPPCVPLPKPAFILPALMESEQPLMNDDATGPDLYSPIIQTDPSFWFPRSLSYNSSERVSNGTEELQVP